MDALPHMDRLDRLLSEGRTDRDTMVDFTVTVYYTSKFKQSTADPQTFIDQVLAETNQGYINRSARLHCDQPALQRGVPACPPPLRPGEQRA